MLHTLCYYIALGRGAKYMYCNQLVCPSAHMFEQKLSYHRHAMLVNLCNFS